MKKIFILLMGFMLIVLSSCSTPQNNLDITEETTLTEIQSTEAAETQEENRAMTDINVNINGKVFQGKIYDDSPCAQQFLNKLPITLTMNELNGNEKYYRFSESFNSSPERVENINSGDIMIYQSDYLVIFYDSFDTSYTYTRLGYITDTAGLKEAAGTDNAEVTFEIA